jgi:hypothetical protein
VSSALFRAITIENNLSYDGYWPMEDMAGSSQFVHGPVQATPLANMPIGGVPRLVLASSSDTPGSKPLPDFSKGQHVTAAVTQVNDSVAAATWTVDHVLFVGDTPSGSGQVLLTRVFFSTGSILTSLDLTGQNWQVDFLDTTGAVTNLISVSWASTVSPFDGQPHLLEARLFVAGGGVLTAVLRVDTQDLATGAIGIGPISNVYKVGVAGTVTGFPLVIGHLAVWNRSTGVVDNTNEMLGNPGETATARVTRLCADYGIPVTVVVGTVPAQLLGPEPIDTLANILDAAADPDNGLLHDAGANGNLVYTSGTARYNAAIAMTLDFNRLQIGDGLASTYDDQDLVTEWTVSRNGGSSANYKSATATDDYASQATVNAASDPQLGNIAGWRTHEGTYDAYRLPSININMRKTPELADGATSLEVPFRISPTNLPRPYPPESFDQFAEGFTTTVDTVQWETDYSCQPYGPWQVAVYGTDRYDAAGTVLTTAESSTGTDITVTPPSAGAWTLNTASLPFTVNIDQEQMTVADVANGTSIIAQDGTFELVQASSGWTPTSCTFVDDAAHVHTGGHAAKMVVTGTPSQAFARMAQVSGIVVGDSYTFHGWAFATSGLTSVQVSIDWFTSGGVFITTSNTTVTLTANVWNAIHVTATAPATAGKAGVGPTIGGTPATGTTCWWDDFAFTHQVGVNGSTQTLTVVRGASGVQTAHSISTPVHVYPLPIYAL